MGATEFVDYGLGATPQEAYINAVQRARFEFGHSGYTGTIAEKHGLEMFHLPRRVSFRKVAEKASGAELALGAERYPGTFRASAKDRAKLAWFREHFGPDWTTRLLDAYRDKWGAAVCFEVRGADRTRALQEVGHVTYDREAGKWKTRRTTKKAFAFMGTASC